jgi:hypothetical protein
LIDRHDVALLPLPRLFVSQKSHSSCINKKAGLSPSKPSHLPKQRRSQVSKVLVSDATGPVSGQPLPVAPPNHRNFYYYADM